MTEHFGHLNFLTKEIIKVTGHINCGAVFAYPYRRWCWDLFWNTKFQFQNFSIFFRGYNIHCQFRKKTSEIWLSTETWQSSDSSKNYNVIHLFKMSNYWLHQMTFLKALVLLAQTIAFIAVRVHSHLTTMMCLLHDFVIFSVIMCEQ